MTHYSSLILILSAVVLADAAVASSPPLFANPEQGRAALMERDDFVKRLSPFDRAARMKTDRDVSEREYLEFVGANVLPWDDAAKRQRTSEAIASIQKRFLELAITLPDDLLIIRTTGREEGGAAYTRGSAIVLPDTVLSDRQQDLAKVISHEIFHVISRRNETLRSSLYKVIGFEGCAEFVYPAQLARRRITNPDAPRNMHRIRVTYRGQAAWAIPVLYATADKYDPTRGGEFFDYLVFRFALADAEGSQPSAAARFADVGDVQGFFEQVGKNTNYIIHPEEILADNFALAVSGSPAPSPTIPTAILRVLQDTSRAQPRKS